MPAGSGRSSDRPVETEVTAPWGAHGTACGSSTDRFERFKRKTTALPGYIYSFTTFSDFCPLKAHLEETGMKRSWILFLLACSLPVDADPTTATFNYVPNEGGAPICGDQTQDAISPFTCPFNSEGVLVVGLTSWGPGGTAIFTLKDGGQEATITGLCAEKVIPNDTPQLTYNLIADCNNPNAGPPRATGEQIFQEWYTDLPWHQKLSTLDSNLIDIPFVLPCEALSQEYRTKCGIGNREECKSKSKDAANCMLLYGIVDVMGMKRTDTVYMNGEGPTPNDCQGDRPCVEVKLEIGRYHTQTEDDKGYEADEIRNNNVWYDLETGQVWHPPNRPPVVDDKEPPAIPSLGFAITEATIFAPFRNWYTGHYCAKRTDSINTSICYDDYWTTGHIAPAAGPKDWLGGDYPATPTPYRPAFFWPRGEPGTGFATFCKAEETACSMVLGKVEWDKFSPKPEVTGCKGENDAVCKKQICGDICNLDLWFHEALTEFDDKGRYPWSAPSPFVCDPNNCTGEEDLSTGEEDHNPFIGFYDVEASEINPTGPLDPPYNTKYKYKSPKYVLPKQCGTEDYRLARQGDPGSIDRLSDCAVNFEIHTSGFHEIWKDLYGGTLSDDAILDISKAIGGFGANQYGRTMFLYAGMREQHVPVSFDLLDDAMSIHDKVYSGSIYVQYLPMVNPADRTLAWKDQDPLKNYKDDFWHAFFMSNHMNQDPDHFIRGIRGRTLWHNEYRSNLMYKATNADDIDDTEFETILGHVDFSAGFQTDDATAPFHGNTCDACHVRNGSGIPLMPNGELPRIHIHRGMKADFHVRVGKEGDYTYTNIAYGDQEVPSMKMVFFDLDEPPETDGSGCDDNDHTGPDQYVAPDDPAELSIPEDLEEHLYQNKIMNFYGNSLPLDQNGNKLAYDMEYVGISNGDGFEVVVGGRPPEYQPKRVNIVNTSRITKGLVCEDAGGESYLWPKPNGVPDGIWPENCNEVSGDAIKQAIDEGKIGFMHLMGRRLGNTPLIEMIPDAKILGARSLQSVPGCLSLAPGTRRGAGEADYNYRNCSAGRLPPQPGDDDYVPDADESNYCYIGRWGWIGDRASLEDQIANAAHVEMNITSVKSYNEVHPNPPDNAQLVRYNKTLCGPANEHCGNSRRNSDITEQEIRDMATYQRWIGIPNRSEYQVASMEVQEGEEIFKELQCDSCHVIEKIAFDYDDNMLPREERDHLQKLEILGEDNAVDYPYLSYLGTDLLMHDMGYLSQVAPAPQIVRENGGSIRDENDNDRVEPRFRNYVQYIRTPALKGMRFNRFVTDSNHNTQDAGKRLKNNFTPGCDFLLHDGRACDAIEAAYLHDGPAVKALGMIEALNKLKDDGRLDKLRAFLYSL